MALRDILPLAISTRQPAACERAPGDDTHSVLLRHRQHIGLDAAHQDRIRRLLGDEAPEPAALRDPLRLDDLVRREGRRAEDSDLALPLQIGECREGLLDVGARVRTVHLIQVDPVGLQPTQAVLDLADDPASRVAALVRVTAFTRPHTHLTVDLGGQDDVVASSAGQRLTNDRLRFTLGVDVSCVNEVDAGIQRSVDDLDRNIMIGLTPGAEHHGAEAERADLHAGTSEAAIFHRPSLRTPSGPTSTGCRRGSACELGLRFAGKAELRHERHVVPIHGVPDDLCQQSDEEPDIASAHKWAGLARLDQARSLPGLEGQTVARVRS